MKNSPFKHPICRRNFLLTNALSFGSLSLRSLITGLPVPFLLNAPQALSQSINGNKFVILNHRIQGDPLNANAPGAYSNNPNDRNDPLNQIEHPTVAELGNKAAGFETPSNLRLGNKTYKAAKPWTTLDQSLLDRTAFWHHGTYVNAHPEIEKVRTIKGAIKGVRGNGTDDLSAVFAQELAPELNTIAKEPMTLGGERVKYDGRFQPILTPSNLKSLFVSEVKNIDKMLLLRDGFIDHAYKQVKDTGLPAARAFMDRYAQSQAEAAQIGDQLGSLITDIDGDSPLNQVKMAVALIQLNLAPVITLGLPFGGDNHNDAKLENEVDQTTETMAVINTLWRELQNANKQDDVVFASLNTFGRTLKRNKSGGRNHYGSHHTMMVFSPNIKAGVVGGIDKNLKAAPINSRNGSVNNPDINFAQTFVSAGKTLAKATGMSNDRINSRFEGGKIINAALV